MIITFEVVHVSDMAPGTENTSLLILTTTLGDWYYNSHFTDEEAEAHKVQITCPKSNDRKMERLGFKLTFHLRQGFCNLGTMTFGAGTMTFCCGVCPVLSSMFSRISDLYSLEASSIPPTPL